MGYTSGKQKDDLPVMVGGAGTSGLQDTNKDINSETLPYSTSMTPNDGDNPAISSGVPAPSGADMRNKSGGSVSEDCPGMGKGC
jgi:hypothetical protein